MVQVRERMRASKETLQKLGPSAQAAAHAVSSKQPAPEDEEDNTYIICLDQAPTTTFHPCGHTVTCSACTQLVMDAKQSCPLCRSPVVAARSCMLQYS